MYAAQDMALHRCMFGLSAFRTDRVALCPPDCLHPLTLCVGALYTPVCTALGPVLLHALAPVAYARCLLFCSTCGF
jgi:hypothetical protein